jgi:predicted DNA-binding mobile mystery protein A
MSTIDNPSIHELDHELDRVRSAGRLGQRDGWLRAIREALGMSMAQFGRRLGLPRQGVLALEQREASGAVTLRTLREAAAALDAELVYAIVPRRSLGQMLEEQARRKAGEELSLLAQAMPPERPQGRVEDRGAELQRRTAEWLLARPRALWDDAALTATLRRRAVSVPAPPTPPSPGSTAFRPPPDAT